MHYLLAVAVESGWRVLFVRLGELGRRRAAYTLICIEHGLASSGHLAMRLMSLSIHLLLVFVVLEMRLYHIRETILETRRVISHMRPLRLHPTS